MSEQFPPRAYGFPAGGLAPQSSLHTGRAKFTEAYAVIPKGVMSDIVTSRLPHWENTRAWIIARPLSGFSETFSHYLMEVETGGGSTRPEPDPQAEAVLFITEGEGRIHFEGKDHPLHSGSYVFLPAGLEWSLHASDTLRFHWIRKRYQPVEGIDTPAAFISEERKGTTEAMPDTNDSWSTTMFVARDDLSHDMHVNIVNFEPGAVIPFEETHVMEHGIFVLEGHAVYRLNRDWVEVEAGDYLWLRAFCPQACYAGGPGRFRYLLYKDVNRHAPLGGFLG